MQEEEFLISAQDLIDLVVACVAIARGKARMPHDGEGEGLTLMEWVEQSQGVRASDLARLQDEVVNMPEPVQAEYVRAVLGGETVREPALVH